MLRFRCALSGLWGFTSTVRPAFGSLTSYLVCYGGCAKGRIKTEASHWIVDAITAAYTSQGLECPFHIRVYSTRVIASCAWLRGMLFRKYALQPAGLLRIPCQVSQAGRSVLGLLSAVGEWLIHVYATSIHVSLLPHTVITLCSPLCYCCCCLPCTQCSSSYTMYILLVYHHVLCWLLFNTVISVQPLTMLLFLLLPCFSAQHTLLLTRYANFVYLGFRSALSLMTSWPSKSTLQRPLDLAGLRYTTSEKSGPSWQSMLRNFLSRPLSFLGWTTAMLFWLVFHQTQSNLYKWFRMQRHDWSSMSPKEPMLHLSSSHCTGYQWQLASSSRHWCLHTEQPQAQHPPTSTHYYKSTSPPEVWDLLVSDALWYHHREAQNHSPEHSHSPFLDGGIILPPLSGMLDPCQSSSNNWKLISFGTTWLHPKLVHKKRKKKTFPFIFLFFPC